MPAWGPDGPLRCPFFERPCRVDRLGSNPILLPKPTEKSPYVTI